MKGLYLMKSQNYIIAFVALFSASSAMAEDVKNPQLSFTASTSNAYATVEGSRDNGVERFEGGINAFGYSLGENSTFSTTVYTGYSRGSDDLTLGVDASVSTSYSDILVYGSVATEYVTSVNTLRGGEFFVTPEVGAGYSLTDTIGVYGSLDYTFNASNSFSRSGGNAELGLNYAVTNEWTMSPYITRAFDTENNTTQLGLRVGYNF
jgi:hypothetical protein